MTEQEEARRIAERFVGDLKHGHAEHDASRLARAYLALLSEQPAREEHPLGCEACMVEIRKAVERGARYLDNTMLCDAAQDLRG